MSEEDLKNLFQDKRVLVTGGTGSIGRVIVERLLAYNPRTVRVLSRDTAKQMDLAVKLGNPSNVRFILGDIRDHERILMACEEVNIIFHAAAFKYVPQGEYNPFEAVQTNVVGTQNLISAALKTPSVTHFIMISTDKAVAPVSAMGASKLLAERLVTSAHYIKGKKDKSFVTVRFGNVIGTSGSVIPIFLESIRRGEAITVTHPDMLRFFMTVSDAVDLTFSAAVLAKGGEIFALKMPVMNIRDLAEVMVERFTNSPLPIFSVGMRAGEKLNEMLITTGEAQSASETDEFFIVIPQIEVGDIKFGHYQYPGARPLASNGYHTQTAKRLSKPEIAALLERAGIA